SQSRSAANSRTLQSSASSCSSPGNLRLEDQLLQVFETRRLLHEEVEARRAPVDLALAATRQADETTFGEFGPLAEHADELIARHVGEPEVDNRDVESYLLGDRERFLCGAGDLRLT